MNTLSLVSIIIPVYNVEKFLAACVDSVLGQTHQNIEVILVNDGSTDGSPQMCDRYAAQDERVRVIHQPNGGAASARNTGIREATGEYIYFLDGDDYIVDVALERAVTCADRDQLDLLLFDCTAVDEQGQIDKVHHSMFSRSGSYPDVLDGPAMFAAMSSQGDYWQTLMRLLLKRDLLLKSGLRFDETGPHEDVLFTFALMLKATRCGYSPDRLFVYRVRQGSITRTMTTEKSIIALLRCLREMVACYQRSTFSSAVDRQIRAHLGQVFWNIHTMYWYLFGPKRRGKTVGKPKSWANDEIRRPLFGLMKGLNYVEDPKIAWCCRLGSFYELMLTLTDLWRRGLKRFAKQQKNVS